MAGHSKFKNIMHRKGKQDAKRAKMFSKLSKEITVAAKMGTPDPAMNPRLRLAVQAARADGMPKDNIERAIKKAEGGDGDGYEELRYEGYGPGNVAIIVEVLTDNRNRAASEVRAIFSKNGGNMGETNSVAFNFQRVGRVRYPIAAGGEEEMMEAAIMAEAEEVESSDDGHDVYCDPDSLHAVAAALEESLGEAEEAKLDWKPTVTVDVDENSGGTLLKLIDALEDNDDVQNVFTNFEMSDELLEKLSA